MKQFSDHKILVCYLKANDRAAFEYLYDKYSGALFNIIAKILRDEDSASDVLQESFLKIWKSIDTFDAARGTLFTWMLNIARNCAIDCSRARGRVAIHLNVEQVESTGGLYSYSMLPVLELTDLRQLMDQLQPDKRQLIDLVYIQGFTQEEVSQMLTIPLGTVKSRIRKTLGQLRSCFEEPGLSLSSV